MTQTRLGSLIEVGVNIAIGFWINFAANLIVLPLFGFHSLSIVNNFYIGLIYTGIAVARSYVIRRWFNARLHAASERLGAQLIRKETK